MSQPTPSSLRIVPLSSHPTQASNTSSTLHSAPSAPGLHDTLRARLSDVGKDSTSAPPSNSTSLSSTGAAAATEQLTSTHPLEARLAAWQATQDNLKMQLLRRNHGIGEPVRRGMELRICAEGEWRPRALGGSARVGAEVLRGTDCEISGWEDVYGRAGEGVRDEGGMLEEVEGRVGMGRW